MSGTRCSWLGPEASPCVLIDGSRSPPVTAGTLRVNRLTAVERHHPHRGTLGGSGTVGAITATGGTVAPGASPAFSAAATPASIAPRASDVSRCTGCPGARDRARDGSPSGRGHAVARPRRTRRHHRAADAVGVARHAARVSGARVCGDQPVSLWFQPAWPWEPRLRDALGAREVVVRTLARGELRKPVHCGADLGVGVVEVRRQADAGVRAIVDDDARRNQRL